ncbi:nitroreductase family deazaflavin-dependent oxidoreductase [Mycobacterium sp. Aquia_216]|uniref:nitroreductase family deazaflavin-dependent oxidoreductase n=1 Tax=Mycobacterium sp. Aquia_216 TaxID=2991729 RepID=UPI00227A359E|nr:nitroreductase family deazaflavin-dependent oxidoreductase [Mycobacterium sp. Aquia_216]WAJ45361.1 nitroreductase family deazaflavin-dependent oxidoreductase [Mycobacterium sp. Aquia_216]
MTDDEFNRRNIEEFRANHGRIGGQFEGAPVLLLHSTGARSGEERVSPMMYLADGDRYLVFASAAGADRNPAWYWNLISNPDASIEVGDEHLNVHADELKGADRDEKYAEQAKRYPGFAEYERKTNRTIPVISLRATGPHQG